MEDDPAFNAGRGSKLTILGQVEMDAAVMDGKLMEAGFYFFFLPLNIFFLNKDLYLGGVACLKGIKHPIEAARYSTLLYVFNFLNFSLIYRSVMENSSHVLLVGEGARKFTIK